MWLWYFQAETEVNKQATAKAATVVIFVIWDKEPFFI
jgi:hypothetical protein